MTSKALRVAAVLGLGEQIGRDEIRARAVVGDDEDLGDSGRQVDGGAVRIVRHHHFGRGHPGVAGTEHLVALRDRSVPYAMAATACAPPTLKTCSIPALRAATSTAGSALPSRVGAVHIARTGQPAIAAGTASMMAVEGSGAEPAGTYRPTARTGDADPLADHSRRGLDAQRTRRLRRVEPAHGTDRVVERRVLGSIQCALGCGELRPPTANASSRTPSNCSV